MHKFCHRCGLELPSGSDSTAFCPHCGSPQLYLQDHDRPILPAEPESTGAPPPPHPQIVAWQTAIRCGALVGGIAALLTVIALPIPALSFLSTIWTLTASMTALALYQRRQPLAVMDARIGARIGLTTGFILVVCLTFAMAAAGVVSRFALHSTGELDTYLNQLLQQMTVQLSHSAAGNPELPQVLRMVASPEFRAGYALFCVAILSAVLLFFSTLGGAAGGLLRTRRRLASSPCLTSPSTAPQLLSSPQSIMTETATRSPKLREKGRLMSASEIERTLVRLAHEVVEKNDGSSNLGLVGIKRRGVPLAQRIGALIEKIEKHPIDTGTLDISFYRDDLTTDGPRPTVVKGDLGFDVTGRDIILMDDVLYTGRTIRAALDALFDHGRPRSVQLLVLIDRGHRELPIQATFTGRTIPTSSREIIEVKLNEVDGQEQVLLVELVD